MRGALAAVMYKIGSLLRRPFVRNVAVLASGSALAQAIVLAFTPVISRLYDPSEFGRFAAYSVVVGLVGCVASLRYDIAIMLPKEDREAANVLALCAIVITAVGAVGGGLIIVFSGRLANALRTPELATWFWLAPVSIFLLGFSQSLMTWCSRRKKFRRAAVSQVVRAGTGPGAQTTAGFLNAGASGLLGGAIFGDLCGVIVMAGQVLRGDRRLLRDSLAFANIKNAAREYAVFPKFTSAQTLLNTASQYLPVFLLAYYFGPIVVGFYAVGMRIIQLPLSLVLESLREVLFQKASEVFNSGGDTYGFFKKSTGALFAIVALPTLAIMLLAPAVASFVLGSRWRTAGEYSSWLVFWLALMFCNSPAVILGQLYRKQRLLLIQDICLLTSRALALVVGGSNFSASGTIILYSMVGVAYNLVLIISIWDTVRQQRRKTPVDSFSPSA